MLFSATSMLPALGSPVSQGDRGLTPGLTDRPSHRHSLAESDRHTEASLIKISPQVIDIFAL